MRNLHSQKGMTAIGWLLVLLIVVFVALITLKLVPVYIDGFKVYSSLESLKEDPSAKGKPAIELRRLLMKRLDINMVTDVTPQDVSISRGRGGIVVTVDYEAVRPMFGNLSVLVHFKKSVDIEN